VDQARQHLDESLQENSGVLDALEFPKLASLAGVK
jgi:hypothetical protein